jgi:hypothetical protein
MPLRYLLLPCPTCRTPFHATSILRGHPSTSFIIQNIVADWRKERKLVSETCKAFYTDTDVYNVCVEEFSVLK